MEEATVKKEATPLPIKQFCILLYIRLCEPFAYTVIFPFVNQMCEFLLPNVPKAKIGAYSGAIESLFAFCQACTMYFWGSLSDRIGRKPVICSGLTGLTLGLIALGSSQTFAFALLSRAACGMLAGNSTALRAVLGEITDETNQGKAYPLFSICFELSMIFAPALGGVLSNPAKQYPNSVFAKIKLFKKLPFLLPCAVVALLSLSACVVCLVFFEETLESKRIKRRRPSNVAEERRPLLKLDEAVEANDIEPQFTAWKLLQIPDIRHCLTAFFLNTFISLGFDSVFILFAYSEPELGGLELSAATIALCLSFRGVVSIIFALTCFAPLHRRFGPKRFYHVVVALWTIAYALPPIMNYLLLHGGAAWQAEKGTLSKPMMALMAVDMLAYSLGDNQFPLIMMALNESAPSKNVLGAVNGMGLAVSACARAVGPFVTNFAYSMSVQNDVSVAVWLLLILISCLAFVQTFWCFQTKPGEIRGLNVQAS